MKLEIVSGEAAGRALEFPTNCEVTIGREESCPICLVDRKVSRRHARLLVNETGGNLEDLGSANGVRVNGQRGFRFILREGDVITVGDTSIRVVGLPGAPASGTPAPRVKIDDTRRTVVLYSMPSDQANLLGTRVPPEVAEELRAENKYLRTIGEISRVLAAPHAAQKTLDSVLAVLREALKADTACVLSGEAKGGDWEVRAMAASGGASASVQVSRTIVQQALDEGVAIIARDPLTDGRFQGSQSIIVEGVSSALCSPIRIGDTLRAVLLLDRRRRSDVFMERDLRLTATVANLLGLLLEKEQAESEARERERLAVIGEVVANLAHHAKNIIASLRFGLSTLKLAVSRNQLEKLPQYVAMLDTQQGRLSELVLNMLSYSKDRTPVRQEVKLAALIEDVVAPFKARLAEAGVTITNTCEPCDLRVWAEEAALHRVFLNLVVNALDALQEKSEREKILSVTACREEGHRVAIRFRDTGCGIPREGIQRIFDVFYSTKGAKGTGLGLAVVKKVVAEHGGSVSVDSEVGAWTEFTIVLPEHAPDAAEAAP